MGSQGKSCMTGKPTVWQWELLVSVKMTTQGLETSASAFFLIQHQWCSSSTGCSNLTTDALISSV